MATSVSDDSAGARRQRQAQRGLSRLLVRDVRKLRRLIIPSRLQETVPDWIEAVRAVVGEYGNASAAAAADFYEAERVAAEVTGRFTVPLLEPPSDEQVDNSLRWATKDLWPRDPDDPKTTAAQRAPLEVRLDAAEKKAEGVAQKLVTDQGRGTVQAAVQQDRLAVGYARAAALGACAFCRLLAARGMVYKQDTADFRAHDGCNCGVIPVFRGQRFELSAHAQEWDRLYREYAAPFPGDQLRRFRRAIAEHG
ncbi:VG15 protein [Streptomyces rubiginosohelvolus]